MSPWWLHLLVFIFGYMTCRTFYFLRASRISLSLILYCQIIYLSAIFKAVESLIYTKSFIRNFQKSAKEMSSVCNEMDKKIDIEISILKDKSINYLINMHPKFYKDSIKFDDWETSMIFLQKNKQDAINFWEDTND